MINEQIRDREVRVVSESGEQATVLPVWVWATALWLWTRM